MQDAKGGAESTALWHKDVAVVRSGGAFRFVSTLTQLSSGPVAADTAVFLTFGPPDDAVFNPGASRSCVILACTFSAGSVGFAAFQGENPFVPLTVSPASLPVPVAERWDQSPLLCCGRGVTVLVASGRLFWLQWTLRAGAALSFLLEHSATDGAAAPATAVELCGHGDRVLVGYADGTLRLFSKTGGEPTSVTLRNCSAPVLSISRVAARACLVLVREGELRVRLFLCHTLGPRSVAELVSASFSFALARVEPPVAQVGRALVVCVQSCEKCAVLREACIASFFFFLLASLSDSVVQAAPSPLRPFVCSVAVAAGRALYFLPLSSACALLDAHAVDARASPATLPLAALHAGIERVMVFDAPLADVFFVCPGVVHITLAETGVHLTKTY